MLRPPADGVKTVFRGHENIIKPQIARISPIRPRSPIPVQENRQLFFLTHNVTLSVAAMRVINSDRSRPRNHGGNTAPTPTSFAEIVGADFAMTSRPERRMLGLGLSPS